MTQITLYRLIDGMLGPIKSASRVVEIPAGWSSIDGAWDTKEYYVLNTVLTPIGKKLGGVQVNLRLGEAYNIDSLPSGTYIKVTSQSGFPGEILAVSGSFTYTPANSGMYAIVFSGATSGVVVLVVGTLAETKQLVLVKLKQMRANKRALGVKVTTRTFNSSPDDLVDLSQAAIVAQNAVINSTAFSRQWLLADNSVVSLTAQQVLAANNIVNKYINDVDARYFALAKAIATSDNATISQIDITTGWPT